MKYTKTLDTGHIINIEADGGDEVLRSLGYKHQNEIDRIKREGDKKMKRQGTKAAKIIEQWNADLTVKENVAKLATVGIKTNICYIYALVGKNKLGFKKVTKKVKPVKTETPPVTKTEAQPPVTTGDAPPADTPAGSTDASSLPGAPSQ